MRFDDADVPARSRGPGTRFDEAVVSMLLGKSHSYFALQYRSPETGYTLVRFTESRTSMERNLALTVQKQGTLPVVVAGNKEALSFPRCATMRDNMLE